MPLSSINDRYKYLKVPKYKLVNKLTRSIEHELLTHRPPPNRC
jgi:hypothetical protein